MSASNIFQWIRYTKNVYRSLLLSSIGIYSTNSWRSRKHLSKFVSLQLSFLTFCHCIGWMQYLDRNISKNLRFRSVKQNLISTYLIADGCAEDIISVNLRSNAFRSSQATCSNDIFKTKTNAIKSLTYVSLSLNLHSW